MPAPEEKAKRKALKQAVRQAERERIRTTLPLLPTQMKALFDFVDQQLSGCECDGTLQKTLKFLSSNALLVDSVVKWIEDAGGHCDCEVLANVEERFLFAFPEKES